MSRETGRSRDALLQSTSFIRSPGSLSREEISKRIDRAFSETFTEYLRTGGVIQLPMTFKSVLKSRILKMLEEKK